MPREPRLRGDAPRRNSPSPLGEIPYSVIVAIGKQIVHRLAVGQCDITGDDFGVIFANAVSGNHRGKPLGAADVVLDECAWSVKTVKSGNPFSQTRIRAISGRNSPDFSQGIENPRADVQATGRAILEIWNARVNESLHEHDDLRVVVMARNMDTLEFLLMEHEATRFIPSEYTWSANHHGNFEGRSVESYEHRFTWQPHGSQFTIIHRVPASAVCFRITHRPGLIEARHVLNLIRYDDSWIESVPRLLPNESPIAELGEV